jgi:hypothetical protein
MCSTSHLHHIQHLAQSLSYTDLPKMTIQYILTLKMATAIFAKMLVSSQHPTLYIEPKSNSKHLLNCLGSVVEERIKYEGRFYKLVRDML